MATSPAASPHALDLQVEERRSIRINGTPYALKTGDDVSFGQWREFARYYNRIIAIENQEAISAADDTEMMALLASAIQLVVIGLPDAVLERLGYAARSAIVATFVKLSDSGLIFRRALMQEAHAAPTPPPPAPSPSAGAPSLPDFPASTAARRSSGRKSSRSARSTPAGGR